MSRREDEVLAEIRAERDAILATPNAKEPRIADYRLEQIIHGGFRHNHILRAEFMRLAADAKDARATIATLTAERDRLKARVEELEGDAKRMDWLCRNEQLGDAVWDMAANLCPIDAREADDLPKWGRAAIDRLMKEAALRGKEEK